MALPVAVLDACVLFPEWLRDLFLRLAEAGLIRVAWTDEILEEMRRNLGKVRNLAPEKTAKLVAAMRRAFPDADVDDYADHISSMTNHPKDRHVLAAAHAVARRERRAVVVTANLKDFPRSSWPRNVKVLSPDEFLLKAMRGNRAAVVDVIWAHAQSRKRPPVSVRELLRGLAVHAPRFVVSIERVVMARTDEQVRALEGRLDNAGDDANEYLVALEDLLLADEDFDAAFTELVTKNRRSTLARLLRLLARDEVQPMILENLRRLGVRLPVDELLALTVDEFDLVLDQAAHAKH